MFPIIVSAAALTLTAPVHSVDISHAATRYRASYETISTVHFQQVEPRFATRSATPVCRWQADVGVARTVNSEGRAVSALGKAIHRFTPLSGSYAGACASARSQIDAEMDRYARANAAEALMVAQQDSATVSGELQALHSLSVKGG